MTWGCQRTGRSSAFERHFFTLACGVVPPEGVHTSGSPHNHVCVVHAGLASHLCSRAHAGCDVDASWHILPWLVLLPLLQSLCASTCVSFKSRVTLYSDVVAEAPTVHSACNSGLFHQSSRWCL